MKYYVGQTVRIRREISMSYPREGSLSITMPTSHLGREGVITNIYEPGRRTESAFVMVDGYKVGVWMACLSEPTPLTPFEESLMAYIAAEKLALGIS